MNRGELKRGFKAFRSNAKSNSGTLKRLRSCKSCKYYDDDSQSCNNNSVTKFDYVEEDNNTYCCYWIPTWENKC